MPKPRGDDRGSGWAASNRALPTGCLLGGAILVAPFLALLYDPAAGLAVTALALTATSFLTADSARSAPVPTRRRLILATALNGALALVCLVALIVRLA